MARNRNGSGSGKRLTNSARRFIDALFASPATPIPELAEQTGIPQRTCYAHLKHPLVQAEIEHRIRKSLSTTAFIKAADRLNSLIGAESEYVAADVSKHILAVMGVRPSSDAAPTGQGAGIKLVINLPGAPQQQPIDITPPQPQISGQAISTSYETILHNGYYATSPGAEKSKAEPKEGGG